MILAVYAATATEEDIDLTDEADNIDGYVIPETDCTYAAIVRDDDGAPANITLPESGTVVKVQCLVGGLIPVNPK